MVAAVLCLLLVLGDTSCRSTPTPQSQQPTGSPQPAQTPANQQSANASADQQAPTIPADQLDSLEGNIYQALAAYNGGPGNADRWAEVANGDVDRFVAEIEFDETLLYVKLVSENLARYRQLYQGYDEPVLPED